MAYKTFANGFPLPASDLNNYLMNQSVIVFANSTARTAALPTPTEGMITYLEDTNTVEVYDGSAWTDINDNTAAIPKSTVTANGDLIVADGASSVTNLSVGANGSLLYSDGTDPSWLANSGTEGDVLQVNATGGVEWATPSGGGGATLIDSGSIVGVSSVTISSIPGTYRNLELFIRNASEPGDFVVCDFTVNNDGSAVYDRSGLRDISTSVYKVSNDTKFFLGYVGTTSGDRADWFIRFFDYTSTGVKLVNTYDLKPSGTSYFMSQRYRGTSAINRIDIRLPRAQSTGTYELWGIS